MAKKKRPKKQANRQQSTSITVTEAVPLQSEERRAEVATVAWMLTALITSVAETVGLMIRLYFVLVPEPPKSLAPLALIPGIALFIGLVTGTICLLLTPFIYRLRRSPPPIMVTIFAVLVSSLPHATLLLKWWRG